MNLQLWLIRHGETEWSLSGAHTSRTDIPLTARGEERAGKIRDYLAHRQFSLVLTSPLQRARETCRVAGYGDVAQIEENLREWDYGVYEGRTTAEIRQEQPDWSIWDSPVPQGEPRRACRRANPAGDRSSQQERRPGRVVCPCPCAQDSGGYLAWVSTARGQPAGAGNRVGEHVRF